MTLYNKATVCYKNKDYDEYLKLMLVYLEETKDYCEESEENIFNIITNELFSDQIIQWLSENKDNSHCHDTLGEIYFTRMIFGNDSDINENYSVKAMKLYKKAVELGNAKAMFNLGYMYLDNATISDNIEAHKLFYESVKLGYFPACDYLYQTTNIVKDTYAQQLLTEVLTDDFLNTLYNELSHQSKKDFDAINCGLEQKYEYPHTVKDYIEMKAKYKVILYKKMHDNLSFMPDVLIGIIASNLWD
jgi:TPR repeat protein